MTLDFRCTHTSTCKSVKTLLKSHKLKLQLERAIANKFICFMIWHQHPFQKHFPLQIHLQVQSTLKHLDLHGNRISTISDSQLNQIQSLVMLNLADNQITIIDDQAFCCLPSLSALDLSFNPLKRMEADTFAGVRNHLEELKIANTSLTLLPSFQLPMLKMLNVSSNHLTFVPPNTLGQLGCAVSKLEHLKLINFFAYYRT